MHRKQNSDETFIFDCRIFIGKISIKMPLSGGTDRPDFGYSLIWHAGYLQRAFLFPSEQNFKISQRKH